jgi:hypothetical protein
MKARFVVALFVALSFIGVNVFAQAVPTDAKAKTVKVHKKVAKTLKADTKVVKEEPAVKDVKADKVKPEGKAAKATKTIKKSEKKAVKKATEETSK